VLYFRPKLIHDIPIGMLVFRTCRIYCFAISIQLKYRICIYNIRLILKINSWYQYYLLSMPFTGPGHQNDDVKMIVTKYSNFESILMKLKENDIFLYFENFTKNIWGFLNSLTSLIFVLTIIPVRYV
jgi:hypothetical protein